MSQTPSNYPPPGTQPTMPYQSPNPQDPGTGKAIASMVLGICSCVFWCLPILGLPVSIVGLALGATNKTPPLRDRRKRA